MENKSYMYTDKSAPEPRATRAGKQRTHRLYVVFTSGDTTGHERNMEQKSSVSRHLRHAARTLRAVQRPTRPDRTVDIVRDVDAIHCKKMLGVSLQAKVSSPLLHDVPIDAAAPADDDHDTLVLGEEMAVALRPHQSDGRAACRLDEDAVFVEEKAHASRAS